MANSIEYIYEKSVAITNVREILQKACESILEEKEINHGVGYKYTCVLGGKFGVVLYFKAGVSSKIVFENAPDEVKGLFDKKQAESFIEEKEAQPALPVYSSIKITSQHKIERIKELLTGRFCNSIELNPTDIITYRLTIQKAPYRFTVTQFNNGTMLLQGVTSPLFDEIKEVVHSVNPLSDVENALIYIPKEEQAKVQAAIEKVPETFKDLYTQAQSLLTEEAFNYLYENDKQTIASAIGILNVVKEANLVIPLYNPILYPFAKVFEGFLIRLMIDKCFFTFGEYKDDPEIAKIGNALREKKFKKYIKDPVRNSSILSKLETVWESLRCHELHSDPAQNDEIISLKDIAQAETRIREISGAIMDGYRILVKNGYTEDEMLELRAKFSSANTIVFETPTTAKEIPQLSARIETDESGKGDYFGPLVIAGVFANEDMEKELYALGVQDSKKNTDSKNQELALKIKQILGKENYSIVFILPEKYNELYQKMKNLNSLLAWGHARAIENILAEVNCDNAIADQFGNEEYINRALMEKGKSINLIQTPKAERDIAVAAASILARDMYLYQLSLLSRKANIALPKGASIAVEEAAKSIVMKHGKEELVKYAKLHFKTTQKVLT
jgi:ribonuclease HIII